jgi:hypothetical protein
LGAETSDVTSACWMVAGSCDLVGSKVAPLPRNLAHDKGRYHARDWFARGRDRHSWFCGYRGFRGVDFEDRDGPVLGSNSGCFVRNSRIACSTRSCTAMPLKALASLSCLCIASEIRVPSGVLGSALRAGQSAAGASERRFMPVFCVEAAMGRIVLGS